MGPCLVCRKMQFGHGKERKRREEERRKGGKKSIMKALLHCYMK